MKENDYILDYSAPQPELSILPNGFQLLVQEDNRFPLVAMRLYVRAGSAYELPEEAGISHLLEHMAFKKGDKDQAEEIVRNIESVGGILNAATSFDYTVFWLEMPAEHWLLGLQALHRISFGIEINKDQLQREKDVVLAELERNEDNPKHRLFEYLQREIWAGTAYARPIIGYRETIEKTDTQRIKDYICRQYQPQSMILVVCGQISNAELQSEVGRLFGQENNHNWQKPILTVPAVAGEYGPNIQIQFTCYNKAYIGLGLPGPDMNSPNAPAIETWSYILGGDEASRLIKKYRYAKDLVDEISVSPVLLQGCGMIYLQVILDVQHIQEFWRQLAADLFTDQVRDFTVSELQRAKLNIEDSLFQTKETLSGLASKLGYFQFFENDVLAEKRYLHKLQYMDLQELSDIAGLYASARNLHACFLLPAQPKISKDSLLESVPGLEAFPKGKSAEKLEYKEEQDLTCRDLGNGCRLVLIPDRTLPYVTMDLSWPGGDLLLTESEQGLAELTARSLLRGTQGLSSQEIRDFLADRGIYLEAHAGRDSFSITTKYLQRFEPEVHDLLEDILFRPGFEEQEIAQAVNEQLAVIDERRDHPLGLMSMQIFPFLFKNHPYGYYHLGDPEEVHAYTASDVRAFWDKQMQPAWTLSVCGQIDIRRVQEFAERLKNHTSGGLNIHCGNVNWNKERQLRLRLKDRHQSHIMIIFPVPGLGDNSNPGITLLNKLLAGQGGILFRELRDKQGLGYAVSPLLWRTPSAGILAFYIGTYADKTAEAMQAFKQLVKDLGENEFSPSELKRAKNLLQVDYYREQQSLSSRCSEASDLLTFGLPLNFQKEMIKKVQEITPAQIKTLVDKHLTWESAYSMLLSPE